MSQFCRSSFAFLSVVIVSITLYCSSVFSVKAWQAGAVSLTSAASYDLNVAPDSIAALFGANLASTTANGRDSDPNTPGVQLPTTLAGVSVEIGGQAAGLFFVSPSQINLQVPPNVTVGSQPIVVRNGTTTVGNGTAQVVNVSPGIFSFNATGSGVAAGVALRIRNGVATYEDIATFNIEQITAKAIDLGPTGDQVFLSLYGTGFRRATAGTARVALAGVEYTPQYAGPQTFFVGLDQLNVLVPRSLLGTGRVTITLNVTGATPANTVEVEVAGAAGTSAPTVTNPAGPVVAAEAITINGSGFAAALGDNTVRIGGVEAQVISGNPTSLNVRVPYGAETGAVSVRTTQGEGRSGNALQVRTSVSGIIETTDRQPLANVKVRALVGLTQLNGTSGSGGAFVLSELPTGSSAAFVSIDGSSINTTPAYGSLTLNQSYLMARDNQFSGPIALQQVSGTSGQVGGGSGFAAEDNDQPLSLTTQIYATAKELPREAWPTELLQAAQPTPDDAVIRVGDVTLTLPGNADITFPDGSKRGLITLTQIENSRTPVSLPGGVFSSAIVQITPFGTSFGSGGTLRFPNTERYPAGTQVRVYRLDQRTNSSTRGRFIQAGFATVSDDGLTVSTAPGVVIEATYYFVGLPRTITNVVGRVLDSTRQPLRRALVRLRGQEAFTDGNGGFALRNVPVSNANDFIIVEASYPRGNGRVDRVLSNRTTPVISGFTNVGDLVMPAVNANQPPVIIAASSLVANAGQNTDFNLVAYDPEETRLSSLTVSGARFAAIVLPATTNTPPILRLTPTANEVGSFTLTITATDGQNATTTRMTTVRVVAPNRAPVANLQRVTTDEDTPIQFTLTGSDPDGDQLKFLLGARPMNGVLTGTFPALTYSPSLNFNGTDSFTFRVTDGQLDSALATVTLVVNSVNDAPVLTVPGAQTVFAGQPLNFFVSATDVDPGQILTFGATNVPSGASFNAVTRQFSWTPAAAQTGTFTVTFTVMDNGTPARSDAKSVTINVTGGNAGWQQTGGPTGGSVSELAVSGNSLLASTLEGFIFRSTDAGQNWNEVASTNLDVIWGLATTGAKVYAVTNTRVLSSNDNGQTWTSVAATYPSGLVTAIAANGNNVFIGLVTSSLPTSGVYRSTDGGVTFSLASTGITEPLVTALAISGTNLIAGTGGGLVFRSTNNGTQWNPVSLGQQLFSVEDALASGNNFYLAANNLVLRSTDSGATFSVFGQLGEASANALHLEGTTLYVATLNNGVYRVDATGAAPLGTQGLFTLDTSDVAAIGTTLLASNLATGVARSTNGGQSWSASNTGLIATLATSLAAGNGQLFSAIITNSEQRTGAVARSGDSGKTWNLTPLPNPEAVPIALAFGNNALLVGWQGAGLFRSTDNGVTFSAVATTIGLTDTRSLLANGATMFAGTATGFYRSTDSGASWAKVYSSNGPIISISLTGTTLYAGVAAPSGSSGGGLLRSVDNGSNWTSLALPQAVTSVVQSGTTIVASVIPNQNVTVGAFRSTDNGATWQNANAGLPTPFTFKLVVSGSSVFAANGGGVFVTSNAGQSWTPFNEGLRNLFVPALILNGNTLFAGTGGSGVWSRLLAQ